MNNCFEVLFIRTKKIKPVSINYYVHQIVGNFFDNLICNNWDGCLYSLGIIYMHRSNVP